MQTIYNLPENIKDDLDRFEEEIKQFKDGTTSPAEFRTFRVPQGVYEQREEGIFMLRVRHFKDEYEEHIREKKCRAKSCKALIRI